MITKLSISHYRSIEHIDLNLGDVHVLVGPNGVGKSNIIDAIKFVRDALKNGLDQAINDRHGIQTIRQWSPTRPYDVSLQLETARKGWRGEFSFTLRSLRDGYEIWSESGEIAKHPETYCYSRTRSEDTVVRYVNAEESEEPTLFDQLSSTPSADRPPSGSSKEPTEDPDDFFLNSRYASDFSRLREMLGNFESYAIFPNTLRTPQNQSKEIYLETQGKNLASILKHMRRRGRKRAEAVSEIIHSLQQVVPGLENVKMQSVAGYLTPQFQISKQNKNKTPTFNVNQMSDGTLRILGLLVALYQDPKPDTIALEEPELTVHPGALRLITDSIKEVSRTAQILVTTHSPEFLDQFQPEQIIAVELDGGITKAGELHKSQLNAARDRLFTLGELMSIEGIHG